MSQSSTAGGKPVAQATLDPRTFGDLVMAELKARYPDTDPRRVADDERINAAFGDILGEEPLGARTTQKELVEAVVDGIIRRYGSPPAASAGAATPGSDELGRAGVPGWGLVEDWSSEGNVSSERHLLITLDSGGWWNTLCRQRSGRAWKADGVDRTCRECDRLLAVIDAARSIRPQKREFGQMVRETLQARYPGRNLDAIISENMDNAFNEAMEAEALNPDDSPANLVQTIVDNIDDHIEKKDGVE